jgi:hypothetical protein
MNFEGAPPELIERSANDALDAHEQTTNKDRGGKQIILTSANARPVVLVANKQTQE